jgi:hypothetical protein
MAYKLYTSDYWRRRAIDARTVAVKADAALMATMLAVAADYDRLARRAAEREARERATPYEPSSPIN